MANPKKEKEKTKWQSKYIVIDMTVEAIIVFKLNYNHNQCEMTIHNTE